MSDRMKALVYEGPRIMSIREVEVPTPGRRSVDTRGESRYLRF
jgi:hypothetical protein